LADEELKQPGTEGDSPGDSQQAEGDHTIVRGAPEPPKAEPPAEDAPGAEESSAFTETIDDGMTINLGLRVPKEQVEGDDEGKVKEATQPTIMFQSSEEKPADLPVKRLGEYVLQRRLGAGGMGEVFLARQESLDREVALKILPKEVAQDKELIDRFYREARSAARLIHPNVVQMYFVGQEDDTTFFAMEYVDGEDLSHRLRRGESFTLEESINIVASVCMALAVAGEQKIVHRDIKPANIMIDRSGLVKVMDFGLAKATTAATHITQAGFVLGTPTYMSPEQGEGKEVDTRSDIYSLGVVFYELLTGLPPFQSENPAALIYQHIHNDPAPPTDANSDIPEEVEAIALKCLAKKPQDRYQSAEELLDDLMGLKEEIRGTTQATIMFDVSAAKDMTVKTPRRMAGIAASDKIDTGMMTPPADSGYAYQPPASGGLTTIAAAVFIVLLVLGSLGYGFRREIARFLELQTQSGGSTRQVGPTGPVRITPSTPDKAILPLSEIKLCLPDGVPAEDVTGHYAIGESRKPLEYQDVEMDPGKALLHLERKGYEPLDVEFDVKPDGLEPRLTKEILKFEPTQELVDAHKKAAGLIGESKYAQGLEALEAVEVLDPNYEDTADLRTKAQRALAEENRRMEALWQLAFDAFKAKKFAEAKKHADEIPPTHKRAQDALKLIGDCEEKLRRAKKDEMRVRSALAKGLVSEADMALADLEDLTAGDVLDKLRADVRKVKSLKEKANAAMGAGDYAAAAPHLEALLALCPESEATKRDIKRCEAIVKTADKAQRLILQIESKMDNKDFEGALTLIRALESSAPGNAQLASLKQKADKGAKRVQVVATFKVLDQALREKNLKAWIDSFHPVGGAERRSRAKSAFDGLASCGAVVERAEHRIEEMLFAEGKVQANTMWEVQVAVPDVGRKLVAKVSQTYTMRPFGEKWLIADVKRRGGTSARVSGGESVKRIQGKVKAIDGDIVTIDRGSVHGVKEKMVFNVYVDAQTLKLPLTEEVLLVRERLVATLRVLRVEERQSTASVVSRERDGKVEVGMLAVYSPVKNVAAGAPQVVGGAAAPQSATMGTACRITLDVANVDGLFVHYVWQADGGSLAAKRTSKPVNTWVAPAKAGDYTVTAALFTQGGRGRVARVKVTSRGPSAARPTGYAVTNRLKGREPLFEQVQDLCFDEKGDAFLLDGRRRVVTVLDEHFRQKAVSERYRGEYVKVLARGGNLFLLDANACEIHRYPAGVKKMLGGAPQAVYGGRGNLNGNFDKPVDMALNSKGELLVLDAERMLVHLFGPHGRFVYSFGSQGTSKGEFSNPVALAVDDDDRAFVLDAKRLKVLIFEEARFVDEFSIDAGQAVTMRYDVSADALLVLYGDKLQRVQGFSTSGKKLAARAFGGPAKAAGASPAMGRLSGVQSLVTDAIGYAYVISGTGSRLDRFEGRGSFAGRMGGDDLGSTAAIAAGPAGEVYLLDSRTGAVRCLSPEGWMIARFGGLGSKKGQYRTPVDIQCDEAGNVYILDSNRSSAAAHKYSSSGRFVIMIGKPGRRSSDGLTMPIGLAVHSGRAAVALNERKHAVHVFSLEGAPQLIMPAGDAQIQNPVAVAMDGAGRVHVANKRRAVETYSAEGRIEKAWQHEFKTVKAMACGPDDHVHVLDSSLKKLFTADPRGGKAVFLTYKIPADLRTPADIAVDGLGNLYLLDDATKDVIRLTPRR